jgi:hypothetical protein
MTFYDITDPPVESALTNIPVPLLRKAIAILGKTGRSQMIAISDGEGVRFLAKSKCMRYIAFIETLAAYHLVFKSFAVRDRKPESFPNSRIEPFSTVIPDM